MNSILPSRLGDVSVWLAVALLLAATPVAAAPIDDVSGPVNRLTTTAAPGVQMPELNAALESFRKGDIAHCREQLSIAKDKLSARSGAGELPPVDLMLARLYIAHGQVDVAKAMLEKIAFEHEGHPEVYLLFGNLALAEGRLTDGLLHFEKSLTVGKPAKWTEEQARALWRESYAGQATIAERRGDWYRAQVALKQWIKADPNNGQLLDRLGAALFMLGRESEAFDVFQTAAREDTKVNPPEVSMAVMYARRQDFDNARKGFVAATKKYPNDGRVYQEFAGLLLLAGDAAEAKKQAAKAAQMGVSNNGLTMHRGYIARQLKEYEAAEKFFAEIVEQSPRDFEASNQLALVLIEQKDDAKQQRARELAELNVRRFPQSSYALSTLGWVYYKLGYKEQSLKALQMAAAQSNVRTETLYFLTRVLWDAGQREDARKVAKQVKTAMDQPGLFVLRPEVTQWFRTESL